MSQKNNNKTKIDCIKLRGDKDTSQMQRILCGRNIEFELYFKAKYGTYKILALDTKKLIITNNSMKEYYGTASNIEDLITKMAISENTKKSFYSMDSIKICELQEEEEILDKILQDALPKKFSKTTCFNAHGETFYVAKKDFSGKSCKTFCAYNMKTRNRIWAHWDKDVLIGAILTKYNKEKLKDY